MIRYQGRLEGFVTRFFRTPIHSPDLVQEVFLTAFQDLSRLRDPSRLKSWLYGMTYRKCLHHARQGRVEARVLQQSAAGQDPAAPAADDPEAAAERASQEGGGRLNLLDRLPPMDALLVWLHYIEDLPYQEISPMVDMNEAAIRQRCRRALAQLREVAA